MNFSELAAYDKYFEEAKEARLKELREKQK